VLFFVLIGLMMVASNNLTQAGKVQKMQPIEQPVLTDSHDLKNFGPMFPSGPRMRE
jgi:hypothetical protein